MPTDWNQKLAWILRDLPDPNLDLLQLSGHRSTLVDDADGKVDVGPRADWLYSSADRVPFPKGRAASRIQVDWCKTAELTHLVAKQRHQGDAVDMEATRKRLSALLVEASKRFDRDPRKMLLWMWRYLPERLATVEGGPGAIANQIPADPRLPNLSVWQRLAFDAALAGAGASPSFLVVQILPAATSLDEAVNLRDLWAQASMDGQLFWKTMLPVIEALGPEAILTPSVKNVPQLDAWLAEQGVTPSEGVDPMPASDAVAATLPSIFVALVPKDRARELGETCKKQFEKAWSEMANALRDKLVNAGWVKKGNEAWTSIWARQSMRAWDVSWTAVCWGEDSTGAGALLPKLEVTAFEKWARVHEDAAGLDDPWPGIYHGLWYGAALNAAAARRHMAPMSVLCEPDRPCSACGYREALHAEVESADAIERFWKPIAGPKGKSKGAVAQGETLCAVCSMRRMSESAEVIAIPESLAKLADGSDGYALILFGLDQPDAAVRGGKELRHTATLGDCVHSELTKPFIKRARSHVKEILDAPASLGPSRLMGVQDAIADFLTASVPTLLQKFGAFAVHASQRELIIVSPVEKAYALTRAMRETHRQAFIEVQTASGSLLAKHMGQQSSTSAVLAIAPQGEPVGPLLKDCRTMLADTARAALGGDCLVVVRRALNKEERLYAAHWDELEASVDVLLRTLPESDSRRRMVRALDEIAPALSNTDLDKLSPLARPTLVIHTLAGIGLAPASKDATAMANAICQMVDHCVRLSHGAEQSRALDGLCICTSLSGADQ